MGQESDQQYFSRRCEEETAAADIATNREARVAHLELAARYAQMAAAIRESRRADRREFWSHGRAQLSCH